MKTLTAKDANYGFGRLIDLDCAEPVAEFERLKLLEAGRVDNRTMNVVKANQ